MHIFLLAAVFCALCAGPAAAAGGAAHLPVITLRDWTARDPQTRGIPCFWLCPDDYYGDNGVCDAMCSGGGSIDPECLRVDPAAPSLPGTSIAGQISDRIVVLRTLLPAGEALAADAAAAAAELAQLLEATARDLQDLRARVTPALEQWSAASEHAVRGQFSKRAEALYQAKTRARALYKQLEDAVDLVDPLEAAPRCFDDDA